MSRKTKVRSVMCESCPWRNTSAGKVKLRGDVPKAYDLEEIRKKLADLHLIHLCHQPNHLKAIRCKGSYEKRKSLFLQGGVRTRKPALFQ